MTDTTPAPPPADEEKTIPKSPHRVAAEAVFEDMPLRSAEDERAMAINWAETAALHLSNETHWRERAKDAEYRLEQEGLTERD